jgi:hypothetical protein
LLAVRLVAGGELLCARHYPGTRSCVIVPVSADDGDTRAARPRAAVNGRAAVDHARARQ